MQRSEIILLLKDWLSTTNNLPADRCKILLESIDQFSDQQLFSLHQVYLSYQAPKKEITPHITQTNQANFQSNNFRKKPLYKNNFIIFAVLVSFLIIFYQYNIYKENLEKEKFKKTAISLECDAKLVSITKEMMQNPTNPENIEKARKLMRDSSKIVKENGYENMKEFDQQRKKHAEDWDLMMEIDEAVQKMCESNIKP